MLDSTVLKGAHIISWICNTTTAPRGAVKLWWGRDVHFSPRVCSYVKNEQRADTHGLNIFKLSFIFYFRIMGPSKILGNIYKQNQWTFIFIQCITNCMLQYCCIYINYVATKKMYIYNIFILLMNTKDSAIFATVSNSC